MLAGLCNEKQHPRIEIEDIEVTVAVHAGKSLSSIRCSEATTSFYGYCCVAIRRSFQEPTRLWKLATFIARSGRGQICPIVISAIGRRSETNLTWRG